MWPRENKKEEGSDSPLLVVEKKKDVYIIPSFVAQSNGHYNLSMFL